MTTDVTVLRQANPLVRTYEFSSGPSAVRDSRLWKCHGEGGALAEPALDGHAGMMAGEDVLDDGEAEAGAAMLAAGVDIDPVEALGEPRDVLLGDARTDSRGPRRSARRPRLPARR